ncbi:MAG TPA: aldo/keto reductase [Sphaerochaeta sp.]|nr:aldo/keto reductase [Sphaerochaeta sp.]HPB41430.1 aldo/keto reductase [Sphaerochaeta sp.]HPY46057.1 aldo/keto reductase [Sphaerochaeta sp.]HQB05178.1 aldo/keto reductase [Sphaerochaeta sp.]
MSRKPFLLGFGAMRLPQTEEGKIDRPLATEMLRYAMEHGVTYYDTAYTYHARESEPFLGEFLQNYDRASFQLATKLPQWLVESVDDARRIFEEQLKRLKVDYFDYYLVHSVRKKTYVKMVDLGVITYLEKEVQAGRIKKLGFSFHSSFEDFRYILHSRAWDFCQIQYNWLDIEEQAGRAGYELATEHGIPVIVMEPIKGGSLLSLPPHLKEQVQQVAKEDSIAALSLRWVAEHRNVPVILSGMSTLEHVVENIATLSDPQPLTDEQHSALEEVGSHLRSRLGNGCTSCSYCMPCPFGVDIPGSFNIWNTFRLFGRYEQIRKRWESMGDKGPLSCTRCMTCVSLCPQEIPIPFDLARVQEELSQGAL